MTHRSTLHCPLLLGVMCTLHKVLGVTCILYKVLGVTCTLYKVLGVMCTLYKVIGPLYKVPARIYMYIVQQNSLWYLPVIPQPSSTWYSMRSFLPLLLLASPLLPSTEPVTRLRDTSQLLLNCPLLLGAMCTLYKVLGVMCTLYKVLGVTCTLYKALGIMCRCRVYIVQGTRCHMYIVQGTRCMYICTYIVHYIRSHVYIVQVNRCHLYIV